jgi:hypothetical protein
MPFTNLTDEELARELTDAKNRWRLAVDWLGRATATLEAARRANRAADAALQNLMCEEGTPEVATAYIAARATDADVKAALLVHDRASRECADWKQRADELEQAIAVKNGEPDDWG